MQRIISMLLAGCLVQPLAEACEAGKPEIIAKGQHLLAVGDQLAEVGALIDETRAAYDALMYEVEETGGAEGWDDEADRLVQDLYSYEAEWEIGYGLALAAEADLRSAVSAHETACGANAQTAVFLAELGLQANP